MVSFEELPPRAEEDDSEQGSEAGENKADGKIWKVRGPKAPKQELPNQQVICIRNCSACAVLTWHTVVPGGAGADDRGHRGGDADGSQAGAKGQSGKAEADLCQTQRHDGHPQAHPDHPGISRNPRCAKSAADTVHGGYQGVPEQYKAQLVPLLKAKPVRTASGIAVVAGKLRCQPVRALRAFCADMADGARSDVEAAPMPAHRDDGWRVRVLPWGNHSVRLSLGVGVAAGDENEEDSDEDGWGRVRADVDARDPSAVRPVPADQGAHRAAAEARPQHGLLPPPDAEQRSASK
eukprot:1538596-Rhodomonas_salina.1